MEVKIMRRKFAFKLTTIFWALVGVFVLAASPVLTIPVLLIPALRVCMLPLTFISWVALCVLGLALIVVIVKKNAEGVQGWLKAFLLLTGASAVGFPASAILHNAVYALFIQLFGSDFWDRIGIGDEPFFFMIAVFVCPIGFLVGAAGSIALLIRDRKRRKEAKKQSSRIEHKPKNQTRA